MNIEKTIIDRVVKQLDLSKYEEEIRKAIDAFFKSKAFKDQVEEALSDEGIAYKIGEALAPSLEKLLVKTVKSVLGTKK